MTKLLRILTGMHSGAELRLSVGTYRIGPDDDADIRLQDWRGTEVELAVDNTGLVSARRLVPEPMLVAQGNAARVESSPQTNPVSVLLVDFVPMQFDDTVVCMGPADLAWPSDLELISMLLNKPDETRRSAASVSVPAPVSSRHKVVSIVFRCSMVGAIIVAGSMLIMITVSRPTPPRDPANLVQRVNQEFASAHMRELHAHVSDSRVVVSGMVPTADDDAAVRALLARVSPNTIVRQYDIAQIDLRDLEESLNTPGLRVKYAGDGVFEIGGAVANPQDVDERVSRIRHDLSPNIRQLRVAVTQSGDSAPTLDAFSEVMSSETVRYVQTPDGVKHITTLPGDDEASAVADEGTDVASGAVAASGATPAPGEIAASAFVSASGPVAAGLSSASDATAAPRLPAVPVATTTDTRGLGMREAKSVRAPPPLPAYLLMPR